MKTVVEPQELISKLWGEQRIKEDDVYRLMRYVIRVDHDGKVLLHNVVTGQLAVLDQEEAEVLEKLPMKFTPVMEQLVSKRYLVSEGFDEYRSVNQLRSIYRRRSTGDAINHYIILPTTFCNAHCFYCYESNYPRVHMTEETANKLINYIDEHRQGKVVKLSWFGGEPLVGIDRIDQISQGLKDRQIPFTSSMISNAYLFNEEIVKRSQELWNLKDVQVTLDGTEEVYNRVKAYASVKDNPYQRVLRNVDLLSTSGILVNIRLNVDFYNKDDILVLIEELGKRYSGNKHINVYLNMLYNNRGYEPVQHSDNDLIELQRIIDEYTERLKELKLGNDRIRIPWLQFFQCMADNVHSVEIQPDGGFCRCEHENIHDSYGNIDEGILDSQKLLEWMEPIERSDACSVCCLYPSCFLLRKCANAEIACLEEYRLGSRKKYEELLRSVYLKSLKEDGK